MIAPPLPCRRDPTRSASSESRRAWKRAARARCASCAHVSGILCGMELLDLTRERACEHGTLSSSNPIRNSWSIGSKTDHSPRRHNGLATTRHMGGDNSGHGGHSRALRIPELSVSGDDRRVVAFGISVFTSNTDGRRGILHVGPSAKIAQVGESPVIGLRKALSRKCDCRASPKSPRNLFLKLLILHRRERRASRTSGKNTDCQSDAVCYDTRGIAQASRQLPEGVGRRPTMTRRAASVGLAATVGYGD